MLLHYGVKGMKWKDHDYVEPQVSEEDFNTLKEIMSGNYKGPMDKYEQEAFVERVGYAQSRTTGKTFMSMANSEIMEKLKNDGVMSKSTKDIDPKDAEKGKEKVDDILKKKGSKKLSPETEAKKAEKEAATAAKKSEQAAAKAERDKERAAAKAERLKAQAERKAEQEAKKIEALKIREEKAAILKEKLEKREALQKAQEAALEARRKAMDKRANEIAEKMKRYNNSGLNRGI